VATATNGLARRRAIVETKISNARFQAGKRPEIGWVIICGSPDAGGAVWCPFVNTSPTQRAFVKRILAPGSGFLERELAFDRSPGGCTQATLFWAAVLQLAGDTGCSRR